MTEVRGELRVQVHERAEGAPPDELGGPDGRVMVLRDDEFMAVVPMAPGLLADEHRDALRTLFLSYKAEAEAEREIERREQ